MAKQFQIRRGNTADIAAFTGAEGELTYDTESKEVRVHDGVTKGGINVSAPVTLTPATPLKAGVIQLATQTEVNGGKNTNKAVTPATMNGGVKSVFGVRSAAPVFAPRAWGKVIDGKLVAKGNASLRLTNNNRTANIKFDTPLPNNNYLVIFTILDTYDSHMQVLPSGQTSNDFDARRINIATNEIQTIRSFSFVVYAEE